MSTDEERRTELKRSFANFIDRGHSLGPYDDKLKELLEPENVRKGKLRLDVNIHDVRERNQPLYDELLKNPSDCIPAFEDALDEYLRHLYPKVLKDTQKVHIGFSGEFGRKRVTPRQLTADCLSALVCLEGIVTKCSPNYAKLEVSVHYCAATNRFLTRNYRDAASLDGLSTSAVYPTEDEDGNPLTTEFGLCTFADHQTVTIQELPETAPPGQLPRSADVTLERDLVDLCKPGDRVSVVGVYRALPPQAKGIVTGMVEARLLANSVRRMSEERGSTVVTDAEREALEHLASEPDIIEQLAASLAPSIYGHKTIKKALVLQMLGGREQRLKNGTHLRGDIHCLLVGDPAVAKSQMLRAIMNVAPLAVSTTGKGSSGVGLTAAVTTDKDTGEARLEAGAMVLADRGLICIDEFDKMNDADRVLIHEVMEQQSATVHKAGIHSSLNARCTVLAAANPLYGSYDTELSVQRNINLPDSLLSRFDLLFVVLDNLTEEQDRAIAEHVLSQLRYRPLGDDGRSVINEGNDNLADEDDDMGSQDEDAAAWMYCKYNSLLHGPLAPGAKPPLSVDCLRKFFAVAKARGRELTLAEGVADLVADFFVEKRSAAEDNALPIGVRSLESLLRLATAVAKARFADEVGQAHVTEAIELLRAMHEGNLDGGVEEREESDGGEVALSERSDGGEAAHSEQSDGVGATDMDVDGPAAPVAAAPAAAPAAARVSEPQLAAVRAALRAAMLEPQWRGSGTLSALRERLAAGGEIMDDETAKEALLAISDEYMADPGEGPNLPIVYDPINDSATFYEG